TTEGPPSKYPSLQPHAGCSRNTIPSKVALKKIKLSTEGERERDRDVEREKERERCSPSLLLGSPRHGNNNAIQAAGNYPIINNTAIENRHQKPTTRSTYTQHSIKTDTEQLNKIQMYAGIKHGAFDAQLIIPSPDCTNNLSSDHELFSLQNNRHLPERLYSS
ncbi:unnamed protein product, partial [Ectocarpus sp. 12 AP-2014]